MYHIMGFAHTFRKLGITARSSLKQAVNAARDNNFGGTDCSIPMVYALQNKIPVDVFIVYTDNETWYGDIHPVQALTAYRSQMGISAKMIECAFTATDVSIADPNDGGMLDICGLDASIPQVIADFVTH